MPSQSSVHAAPSMAETPAPRPKTKPPVHTEASRPQPTSNYNPMYCGVTDHASDGQPSSLLLTIDDFPYGNGDLMIEVARWAQSSHVMMLAFPLSREVDQYDEAHHANLIARIRGLGTYVGNHTHDHPFLTEIGGQSVKWQLAHGIDSSYVRPPYGDYSPTVRRTIETVEHARVCHWTIDLRDWQKVKGKYPSAETLVQRARDLLKPVKKGTPIVILGHYQTNYPKALPAILQEVKSKSGVHVCEAPMAPTTANVPFPVC